MKDSKSTFTLLLVQTTQVHYFLRSVLIRLHIYIDTSKPSHSYPSTLVVLVQTTTHTSPPQLHQQEKISDATNAEARNSTSLPSIQSIHYLISQRSTPYIPSRFQSSPPQTPVLPVTQNTNTKHRSCLILTQHDPSTPKQKTPDDVSFIHSSTIHLIESTSSRMAQHIPSSKGRVSFHFPPQSILYYNQARYYPTPQTIVQNSTLIYQSLWQSEHEHGPSKAKQSKAQ